MLELNVSENPSVLDLAIAFKNQLDTKVKTAEADIIDAELHVANAQRIAQAARSRHQSEACGLPAVSCAKALRMAASKLVPAASGC